MSILILDWETTIKASYGRKANPFDKDNRVVLWGIKQINKSPRTFYETPLPNDWLDGIKMIVAHNAKFDMTWIWDDPYFRQWLKDGGKVWCTQYAEYLLTGQMAQWNSLDQLSEKYGGTLKNDEIKAFWEAGIDTTEIPKDMLVDYLHDDLSNTEIAFKAQVKRAKELGMMNSIHSHMEGLLALTEMEFNGLYIDQELGETQRADLESRLQDVVDSLAQYIPENLPEEVTWNWASKDHLSALFFGGGIKYKRRVHKQDPETGEYLYTKAKEDWYVLDGEPVNPKDYKDTSKLDRYKSGMKAGKLKTKKVDVQGDPKLFFEDFEFDLEGITQPLEKWETKKEGVYKTDADVLTELSAEGVKAAKLMLEWRKIDKDLGTYYRRYDAKKKCDVGMLTMVQPDGLIHHGLNNVGTVTGRLSSSKPNLQNVSSGGKSKVKSIFTSRFGEDGYVCESDFSQLEVVIQGWLSGDPILIDDINSGVDFHIKRLAAKLDEPYQDVYEKTKVAKVVEYVLGRQNSKEFSFQRAYGAGAAAISESTGMEIGLVKDFIKAEEEMYSGVVEFNQHMTDTIKKSRKLTSKLLFVDGRKFNQGVGWFGTPTGKRYVFKEEVAPKFLWKKPSWNRDRNWTPTYTSFSPTQIKNYPVQGLAGEVVIMCLGIIFRKFLELDNFNNRALMINSVHDCVWLDAHKDVVIEAGKMVEDVFKNAQSHINTRYKLKCPVRFRAETEIGKNFLDMHEIEEFEEMLTAA